MTGFWVENALTGRRHFVSALKGADSCKCGCRGHCSIAPIMMRLKWMLHALQQGRAPSYNPDGTPYIPDGHDGMVAGTPLTHKAVLLWVKGYWAEHQHSLGLASCMSTFSPCQFCSHTKEDIADSGHTMCQMCPDWLIRTAADYETACRMCEKEVMLNSPGDLKSLLSALKWKKDPKTIGGRVIFRDVTISGTKLEPGDRVEPSASLFDIGALERISIPNKVVLRRPRLSDGKSIDSLSHRSVLFSTRLHASPASAPAADYLHTVSLGVALRWTGAALWRPLLSNPWGARGDLAHILTTGVSFIKAELQSWQRDPHNNVPQERRLDDFTFKMMGKRGKFNMQEPFFLHNLRCSGVVMVSVHTGTYTYSHRERQFVGTVLQHRDGSTLVRSTVFLVVACRFAPEGFGMTIFEPDMRSTTCWFDFSPRTATCCKIVQVRCRG